MVEEGMKVQEGQVLARLDDTNVKAGLRLAEAQLTRPGKAWKRRACESKKRNRSCNASLT